MEESRAVRIRGAGGVECLYLDRVEMPEAGMDEVAVKIMASGLNRADCLQRRGFYPAPKGVVPDIPGLEFAGIVKEIGTKVDSWNVGDRVMGICAGGAMATHIVAQANTLLRVPKELSMLEAAAVPEVFMTAYDALCQGQWKPGSSLLIHAIGSGVGSAALELTRNQTGTVIGTSRSFEKVQRAIKMGIQQSFVISDGLFADEVKTRTDGKGVDCILDFVGAAYLSENVKSLARGGHLMAIGLLSGVSAKLPMAVLLAKQAKVVGTVLRSRPLEEKIQLTNDFNRDVLPRFASKEIQPLIDRVFVMEDIALAHEYMENNRNFVKIVMKWENR